MPRPSILETLHYETEMEGYAPNSSEFNFQFTKKRVGKCQEMHSVHQCEDCIANTDCELITSFNLLKYARHL